MWSTTWLWWEYLCPIRTQALLASFNAYEDARSQSWTYQLFTESEPEASSEAYCQLDTCVCISLWLAIETPFLLARCNASRFHAYQYNYFTSAVPLVLVLKIGLKYMSETLFKNRYRLPLSRSHNLFYVILRLTTVFCEKIKTETTAPVSLIWHTSREISVQK